MIAADARIPLVLVARALRDLDQAVEGAPPCAPNHSRVLKGFRDFIMRGNVVDLAVAVVIGAAFGAVVTAFATDFITPLIAAIGGKPDFSDAGFTINGSKFVYGSSINALISFLIVAAVIYFLVVMPMNALMARSAARRTRRRRAPPRRTRLLTEIRDLLGGAPLARARLAVGQEPVAARRSRRRRRRTT